MEPRDARKDTEYEKYLTQKNRDKFAHDYREEHYSSPISVFINRQKDILDRLAIGYEFVVRQPVIIRDIATDYQVELETQSVRYRFFEQDQHIYCETVNETTQAKQTTGPIAKLYDLAVRPDWLKEIDYKADSLAFYCPSNPQDRARLRLYETLRKDHEDAVYNSRPHYLETLQLSIVRSFVFSITVIPATLFITIWAAQNIGLIANTGTMALYSIGRLFGTN